MSTLGSTQGPRTDACRLMLTIQVFVCAGVVAAGTLGSVVLPLTHLLMPLAVASVLLLLWGLASWFTATGSIFNLYGIFWTTACLFHVGQFIVVAMGKSDGFLLQGFIPQNMVVLAGYMSLLGLSFTHLGALYQARKETRVAPAFNISDKSLRAVGIFLLLLGTATAVPVYLHFFTVLREGGYLALYREAGDDNTSRLFSAASVLVPGVLFFCAGSREIPKLRILSVVLGVAFAAMNFAVGMRAMAMFILLGLPLVWHYSIKRISPLAIVGAAVVLGGFVLPLVSALRATNDPTAILGAEVQKADPVTEMLKDTGFSLVTLGFTYQLVPAKRDYDFGRTYGYATTAVLPDSISKPALNVFSAGDKEYTSDWLIREVDPDWATLGGGFGYSYLAEAYFNFGWFGLVLVTPIIGLLIAWASKLGTLKLYPGLVAMVGSMAGPVAAFPRSETMALVRLVGWYAVAPLLMAVVVERFLAARQNQLVRREIVSESA